MYVLTAEFLNQPVRPMRFEYIPVSQWPPLAWLARSDRHRDVITVAHGLGVETHPDWFAEGVWAGPFERGDFDTTDIVAGSGGRLRDGTATFVSSGSTVDRLQALEQEDAAWVSNSMACLLASTGAELDLSFPLFVRHFRTVVRGIRKYERQLPTSIGPVQLVYFDNVVWDGRTLTTQAKPQPPRDFSTFANFRSFLRTSMQALADNAADRSRKRPYSLLTTASSGYDSSTATVLGHEAGCRQVLCVEHDKTGADDSGEPLARTLGMPVTKVRRFAWRDAELPEVPFVGADAHGGDIFFKGAEPQLANTVLLTGFHGDKVWDKHVYDLSPDIVRGDQSGLSLTEYRLMAQFAHCSVPFWGVRQIREINALSLSDEMRPWDIGGDYSRPICRRIIEEAGVARGTFATQKKATWVHFLGGRDFLTSASLRSYLAWLRDNRGAWLRRGRVPPVVSLELDRLELAGRNLLRMAPDPERKKTLLTRVRGAIAERPTRLRRYVYPWALEQLKASYPKAF